MLLLALIVLPCWAGAPSPMVSPASSELVLVRRERQAAMAETHASRVEAEEQLSVRVPRSMLNSRRLTSPTDSTCSGSALFRAHAAGCLRRQGA